jgi:hypothetical protein
MWIMLILFICFLLVVGYFVSNNAIAFTVKSVVGLGALGFVFIISAIIWSLNSASNDTTKIQNPVSKSQPDPFPFYNADQQYTWYDRHNVPMSNRCYTTMTTPCSDLEWKKALGVTLTQQDEYTIKQQWCQKFAGDWNQTIEQCLAN